jgi:hypothetical protein
MEDTYYDEDEQYKLETQNDPILIRVVVGAGMGHTYEIYKDEDTIAKDEDADAGDAESCNGSEIKIVATITDTVTQTNMTTLRVEVHEGGNVKKYQYENELPADSDTAIYTVIINMAI